VHNIEQEHGHFLRAMTEYDNMLSQCAAAKPTPMELTGADAMDTDDPQLDEAAESQPTAATAGCWPAPEEEVGSGQPPRHHARGPQQLLEEKNGNESSHDGDVDQVDTEPAAAAAVAPVLLLGDARVAVTAAAAAGDGGGGGGGGGSTGEEADMAVTSHTRTTADQQPSDHPGAAPNEPDDEI
jgi:hypothetical protein